MNCKHCGHEVVTPYCGVCGQRVITRFTWAMVMDWLREELFVLDHGFFFTIKELLVRPVTVMNEYLNGLTRKYYNPFKLLLILSTAPVAILLIISGDLPMTFTQLLSEAPPGFTYASMSYLWTNWPMFMVPNLVYHIVVTTLLLSVACRLLFRKRELNLLEHLIFVCFMSSFILLLNFSSAPFYLLVKTLPVDQFLIMMLPIWSFFGVVIIMINKRFYNEPYWMIIPKSVIAAYGSIGVSMSLQIILLSIMKVVFDMMR